MTGVADRFASLSLQPHSMPPAAVRGIEVSGSLIEGRLTLQYRLQGDLARLCIPARAAAPQRRDGLWRHTCFELFARQERVAGYREFNFSPSGDWAAYAFDGYRSGSSPMDAAVSVTADLRAAQQLQVSAELQLPAAANSGELPWQVNLTAVVETEDGGLSYWALHHPAPQPDFHHPAGFTLRLGGQA